jgi:uncharacterized protein (TIGR01777 family)
VKLVVSGASGLLGSELVPVLAAGGHEVLRLVRRTPTTTNEIAWDPGRGTIDSERLAGVEAAVNLNGATIGRRWTPGTKAEIRDSRVDSTQLLSKTLATLEPRPAVLVCAGGVGIYGDRDDEILTEESPLGNGGFLSEVGKAWEAAAEPARKAGIRVVNFRQGIVLTRKGGALQRLLTPFKLGVGGRVGSGRQWWSWVALDDFVSAYRFVLERDDLAGPINLTSPEPVTNTQFARSLGRALRRPTVFPFPSIAARTVFGEMAEEVLLEGQRALPARLTKAGFSFTYPDLDRAFERALAE